MAERDTQPGSIDLSELESQFADMSQVHQEQFRAYAGYLGLFGDKPRFLTTTTPDAEWLMFAERSGLGNPYHTRVRAIETRYDKVTGGRMARDMLIDLTDLRVAILEMPIMRYPEFEAERAPGLSFSVESDMKVWFSEGRKYQSMYKGQLAKILAEEPADDFTAVEVLGKYAKGIVLDVVGQERHFGVDDALQTSSLNLAA